ncbi:hypothetical protein B0H14DRAFT_2608832 [Mycena olivaceomarginata]|nr:hypothetical protein B0H14DRAFT_2608832 [Mycena olivaceomarginata]
MRVYGAHAKGWMGDEAIAVALEWRASTSSTDRVLRSARVQRQPGAHNGTRSSTKVPALDEVGGREQDMGACADAAEVDVDEGGCCALRGALEASVVVVPAVMLMLVLEHVVVVDAEGTIFVSADTATDERLALFERSMVSELRKKRGRWTHLRSKARGAELGDSTLKADIGADLQAARGFWGVDKRGIDLNDLANTDIARCCRAIGRHKAKNMRAGGYQQTHFGVFNARKVDG